MYPPMAAGERWPVWLASCATGSATLRRVRAAEAAVQVAAALKVRALTDKERSRARRSLAGRTTNC